MQEKPGSPTGCIRTKTSINPSSSGFGTGNGSCEFMSDFAFEFPVKVFLQLMGLPQSRVKQFLAWEHGLLHEPDIEKIKDATRSVVACLREEIEDRRVNPRDDFITFGLQAEVEGRKFDDNELVGFCFNLFSAASTRSPATWPCRSCTLPSGRITRQFC